jgi:hypothetical protein
METNGTSFYTSYAKDVFIALLENEEFKTLNPMELMDLAVQIVKKAKEQF